MYMYIYICSYENQRSSPKPHTFLKQCDFQLKNIVSYESIFVSYITYYHNQVKDIHAFAKSFGWVSGVTMIMNGIFRSIYFFSKHQPVQWSRSVAFLNVFIGAGIIYAVLKKLYITLNVLLYIVIA